MRDYVRAYEGNKPYIFVSYAHLDSDMVLPVIRALYEKKYRVWYDEGISPGSEWPDNIERHLFGADTVLVFVSAHSLASVNCENEVRAAAGQKPTRQITNDEKKKPRMRGRMPNRRRRAPKWQSAEAAKKKIITVSLDGAALSGDIPVQAALPYDDGRVIEAMSNGEIMAQDLIGDGVSGYSYEIEKKKRFNIWNGLLALAALLVCGLLVSLYGLYVGWFDELLPAKQIVTEQAAPTVQPKEESVSIDETMIGSVLAVMFSSDAEREAVYQALGWTGTAALTYRDLNGMDQVTQLDLTGMPIVDLSFTAYLPNLESINLCETRVVDLSPLSGCAKLKTVQVSVNMLPLDLAPDRTFDLEVI